MRRKRRSKPLDPYFGYHAHPVGAWRSLVAHLHGVQGVGSSNLLAPTNYLRVLRIWVRYTLGYTFLLRLILGTSPTDQDGSRCRSACRGAQWKRLSVWSVSGIDPLCGLRRAAALRHWNRDRLKLGLAWAPT